MKRIFAGLLAAIFLCGMIPALAEPVADAALLPLPMGDPNPASRFMFTGQSYISAWWSGTQSGTPTP